MGIDLTAHRFKLWMESHRYDWHLHRTKETKRGEPKSLRV